MYAHCCASPYFRVFSFVEAPPDQSPASTGHRFHPSHSSFPVFDRELRRLYVLRSAAQVQYRCSPRVAIAHSHSYESQKMIIARVVIQIRGRPS